MFLGDSAMSVDRAADATGITLVAAGSVVSSIQQTAAAWFPLVIGGVILLFRAIVEAQKHLYMIRHNARIEAQEALSHEIEEAKLEAVRSELREQSDARHLQNRADIHAIRDKLQAANAELAVLRHKVESKHQCPLAVDGVPACEQAASGSPSPSNRPAAS
jgi:hypothetical protein